MQTIICIIVLVIAVFVFIKYKQFDKLKARWNKMTGKKPK